MTTPELIIKHLNTLQYKHQQEKDLLIDMKKKPVTALHETEIDINIDYLEKEIKEIKELVEILEREQKKYSIIPMEDLSKVKSIRINPFKYVSDKEELILSRIENLNFSPHTFSTLKAMEINTVQELISISKEDLKKYRNLGKNGLKEIEEFKKNNGL